MRRWMVGMIAAMLVGGLLALAEEPKPPKDLNNPNNPNKALEEQYMAISAARGRAEWAVRRARTAPDELEPKWRVANQALDADHARILEAIRKAVEDEQKRPEELRNPAVIEELNQRRTTIEQDWQRLAAVDRPAIESRYRSAGQVAQGIAALYGQVVQLDAPWKDNKMDLPTLQAAYEAVTKRANDLRQQADDALADLQKAQKLWERAATAATTRPGGKS